MAEMRDSHHCDIALLNPKFALPTIAGRKVCGHAAASTATAAPADPSDLFGVFHASTVSPYDFAGCGATFFRPIVDTDERRRGTARVLFQQTYSVSSATPPAIG
jgi:hypothetical protein